MKRLGILTAGGDAPGLNAVIRAAVKAAHLTYHVEIVGIRDGFEGLLNENGCVPLSLASVRGILPRGGTILGTRNTGRFHLLFEDVPEKRKMNLVKKGIATLQRHRIDALIAVGGEGTLAVADRFHRAGFPVIGVPKTIDNDLAATDFTFGFDTAVSIATESLDRLTTTAESHNRVMILEVMGRYAGWIALWAGIAGGADIILIPEIPFRLRSIADHIRLRESTGATHHIIVVAEGARPANGKLFTYETRGGKRLGGIAEWLSHELQRHVRTEIRHTVLGHIQRGGSPSSFDRVLASRFGAYAVRMALERRFGHMVRLQTPEIGSVPISEAISVYHKVDPNSGLIRTGRAIGVAFGD